ncbi:uncharacterized protein [Amphiura filiformis]|uniref:uncharacterized protein n=1 Tax=Amphiura filiformis TaxID=82378 RepID=UPI003B216A71
MSDIGMNIPEDQDDITILHDLQLHDEDGNPYPIGSPPQFQFFSEGGAGSTPPDTAGSTVALKTAYDHVRGQNEQYRKQNEHLKKMFKAATDKLKQSKMLAQVTPILTIHSAAASGNVDQIHELLETGIEVNARNSEGRSALHTAATSSQSNVCSLLLHAKADPNAVDNDGRCPIHIASRNGDLENSSLLIEFGADVNAMDRDGRTPLHIVAANGYPELCKLLIDAGKENGLEINQTDMYGQTPLSMAKVNAHQDVFKILEDAGASLPSEDNDHHLSDRADDIIHGNSEVPPQQQIPKLLQIIQSLYRILGILINRVDVIAAEFPDIRERIEKLILSAQLTESSDVSELNSIEQTVEGVIGLEDWLTHRPQSERDNVVASGQTDLERQLADVRKELSVVRNQLEQECYQTKALNEKVKNQEVEIGRLMTDAENLDLYSATNLGEQEGETYDIGRLFY